ncbi:MAG: dihydrofolate reductase [Chitinophagaceae bacterium]|nr:dihydrofolate reductase [Chitinophagaceae bacterium]
MIVLAAAFGLNNELGTEDGKPLWNLPDEYNRFRESILGHPIILGRKSWDVVGEPIPGSLNIVITRRTDYAGKGVIVTHSIEEALEKAGSNKSVYVIGGGDIFNLSMKYANRLEVSRIDAYFPDATAFFPEISKYDWKLTSSEKHGKDARHAYSFEFQIWERQGIAN